MVTHVESSWLPRIGTPRREERRTLGGYLNEVGGLMGYDFHEWQDHLSDVSMELVPRTKMAPGMSTHRLAAQYVGAMVGRQSGKSAWCATRVVAQAMLPDRVDLAESLGLEAIKPQHVVYTAQSRMQATQRWNEHVDLITACPDLDHMIAKVFYASGREILHFRNGSTYRPITPNRVSARGLSLDCAIVDEALAHPMWLLPVLRPTMAQRDSATGCLGSQFVVLSNAGDDDSELLNRMQELGIESINDPDAMRVWMEWSADPACDTYDEAVWFATMPTLGRPNGIDIDFIRMEAKTLREDQFRREYLCLRSNATHQQIIPMELWMELARTDVMVPLERLVIGLDIRHDRMGASLVACGPVGTYLPLEVVEAKQGLEWVLERTIAVAHNNGAPVAIDVAGPAANLIAPLEAHGVTIIPMAAREVTLAAASLYDACYAKRVSHMNDYRLNDAVVGASRRAVGERWAFDRRGQWDISPLVAASLALWGVENASAPPPTIWT